MRRFIKGFEKDHSVYFSLEKGLVVQSRWHAEAVTPSLKQEEIFAN